MHQHIHVGFKAGNSFDMRGPLVLLEMNKQCLELLQFATPFTYTHANLYTRLTTPRIRQKL